MQDNNLWMRLISVKLANRNYKVKEEEEEETEGEMISSLLEVSFHVILVFIEFMVKSYSSLDHKIYHLQNKCINLNAA